MNKVLVTGGLGYIGSHTVVELIQDGFEVIIVDNLSNSQENVLDKIGEITGTTPKLYIKDVSIKEDIESIFQTEQTIEAVIHFAASKAVGESVEIPIQYYRNNVLGLLELLQAMKNYDCNQLIFSSTASVYGETDELPIKEITKLEPCTNPYGRSKLMCEQIIKDSKNEIPDLKACIMRYFNPIGAHPSGLIGEDPEYPNNLLPYVTQTAAGKRQVLTVFGDDYDTPDGTCLRDYIHVMDLAKAHIKALTYNEKINQGVDIFNLGLGKGVSVLEIIHTFEEVNQVPVNYRIGPRREGDVPALYTDNHKAKEILKWKPSLNLGEMLRSAWNFEKKNSEKSILDEPK